MAKGPKKQKAKANAADQPVDVHAEPSNAVPAVHASHDVTVNNPAVAAGGGYGSYLAFGILPRLRMKC